MGIIKTKIHKVIDRYKKTDSRVKTELLLLTVLLIGYIGLYGLAWLIAFRPPTSEISAYTSSSIVFGVLLQSPSFFVLLLIPSLILLASRNAIRWGSFEYGRELRVLIMVVAFPLLWTHTVYEYNFFLNQPHHFDRLLLIALYILIWRHPLFTYPFFIVMMTIMGQFSIPFGGLSVTDRMLPINIVILFSAYLFLQLRCWNPVKKNLKRLNLNKITQTDVLSEKVFLWAGASIVGASYFYPGILKLKLQYPFRERLYYYIPDKYTWGWLGHLETDAILRIYSFMQVINLPAVAGAVIIEVSAVFIMWKRKISTVIILAFVIFHTVVFAVSGIAFWKWVIVDLILLWFILTLDKKENKTLYDNKTIIIVTSLIVFSPVLFNLTITPLAWYTDNYETRYSIEAVSSSGENHTVHWSQMRPFDYTFSSNRFHYLDNESVITGTSKNYKLIKKLRNASSKEDVNKIKQKHGENLYDRQKARMFDCFINSYFNNKIERENNQFVWSKIPWAPHFWSTQETDSLPADKQITHIQIKKTENLYTKDEIKELETNVIRDIPLNSTKSFCV